MAFVVRHTGAHGGGHCDAGLTWRPTCEGARTSRRFTLRREGRRLEREENGMRVPKQANIPTQSNKYLSESNSRVQQDTILQLQTYDMRYNQFILLEAFNDPFSVSILYQRRGDSKEGTPNIEPPSLPTTISLYHKLEFAFAKYNPLNYNSNSSIDAKFKFAKALFACVAHTDFSRTLSLEATVPSTENPTI